MHLKRLPQVGVLLSIVLVGAGLWSIRIEAPPTVELNPWGNGDQFTYFHPLYKLTSKRWSAGELPLWNPWQLAGLPLAATPQASTFYPPNLLYVLLATHTAMRVLTFFHLLLATYLLYAFGRVLGVDRVPALLGGFAYGWSSFVTGWHLWPPALAVLSWFPLPLLGIALVVRGKPLSGCYAIAFGLAMQVFSGHPPLVFFGFQAAGLYGAFCLACSLRARGVRHASRAAAWVGGGAVLGVLVSSIQWLPTFELTQLATRNPGGLTSAQIEPFGARPLVPALLASLKPAAGSSGYAGTLVFLLIPAAWLKRDRRSEAWFFGGLAIFFGILALGSATPLFELYLNVPGVRMFRGPARALGLFVLAISMLAALGAHALLKWRRDQTASRRSDWTWLLLSLGVAAPAAAAFQISPLWAVLVSVAAILACTFIAPRWLTVAALSLVGVLVADLGRMPPNQERQIWRSGARAPLYELGREYRALASDLAFKRVLVAHNRKHQVATFPRSPTRQGLYVFTDYEPLSLRRYADYAHFLQHGRLYDPEVNQRPYAGDLNYRVPMKHPRLLAAAGVHGIVRVTSTRRGLPLLTLEPIPNALPRAYLVHGIKRAETPAATLQGIAEGSLQLAEEVALESPPPAAVTHDRGAQGPAESVRILRYEAEKVSLEAVLDRPGALVLLDADYPGWRATVNGRSAPIYNANYLFRAVLLEPGRHAVEFEFAPASLGWGFALAAAGFIVLGLLAAERWRRARWARRKQPAAVPAVGEATHA